MNDTVISVLLVEDDASEAGLIHEALKGQVGWRFQLEWVTHLAAAQTWLSTTKMDLVLLDLSLPDGQGIEVFEQIHATAPHALILILCAPEGEEVARQAVQCGAQDYMVKGHVSPHWLPRALRYLIERKVTRDALRGSEARFRAMSDASPLGIVVSDADGGCIYTNAAYQKISGLSFEQTLGTNWSMAIHPDDRQRVLTEWQQAARGLLPFHTEFRFLQDDGSVIWTRLHSAAMQADASDEPNEDSAPLGHVQTIEDITERKSAEAILRLSEEALFEQKERAQVTLNSIGDAVLTTDLQGQVTYLNLVAETMTGWNHEEALGRPLPEVFKIVDGANHTLAENPAKRAIAEDQAVGLAKDCVLIRRDGFEAAIEDSAAPIHNREGKVTGAVIVFHDVSQSRAMAQKMAHLAQHDFLTDLPNRAFLTERLAQAIRLAQRHHKQIALLFIDLDYFKNINDSLGHAIGDQLLQSVADRLVAGVRSTDTVARQGGDEFVILLGEIEQSQDASHIAEKLLAAFAEPHHIDGHELHVSLSIGISIWPDDGISVEDVMQNADTAMFHAKAGGRNNYQFFRAAMNTSAVHRLSIESSLRRALKLGEFELHYQPKINLSTGIMTGAEALLRWQDPLQGMVYPAQFVSIAEECGLIVPISRWLLRSVCRQMQDWLDKGLPVGPVSVNVSALDFRNTDFLAGLILILKETGLAPRYLELELTESLLMHDVESSATLLQALKAMGIRLAIDDFGTGYSSLSYLQRFPIDTLKIDQSFVHDIATDADSATIVAAVIGMGKNLNKRVIAEGVETKQQLDFLRSRHCDEGQGFLFSYPLPAEEFEQLLVAGYHR